MMRGKKGFTLIELLIVVAIIAILAAIAVPNFLEAQVRSKVSRQNANMRTVATAMEAYMVEYNHYPPCTHPPYCPPYVADDPRNYWKIYPGMLTTPLSFISSEAALEDIFRLPHNFPEELAETIMYLPSIIYDPDGPYVQDGGHYTYPDAVFYQKRRYGEWVIRSAGPDLFYQNHLGDDADYGTGSSGWNLAAYDPTNGTVSGGDIYRSQKRADESHT